MTKEEAESKRKTYFKYVGTKHRHKGSKVESKIEETTVVIDHEKSYVAFSIINKHGSYLAEVDSFLGTHDPIK